ncbi:hypothetical protein FHS16_002067 [Paenibacillus endophyticus]|uniref:Anti-sigma factor n=2 Tax=Paenibacillus endophyticus TaxID=1294268 RepID=A0A7W5G9T9_9BACL|nr:anti-sigma factor C-terminal domain-containing protein [Paenibacillus endophyticus]MBB3152021.1 hypothetical protein [Paenibacillus endophyticus]
MSERFKQLLRDYEDDKLSAEERAEVEQELKKLEVYQTYMDEMLERGNNPADLGVLRSSMELNPKQARKLMKRGKRKARFWSVGTVFGMLLLFGLLNSSLTSLYYTTGSPMRQSVYSDVLRSALSVSRPNIGVSLSSTPTNVLATRFFGTISKQIGSESETVGTYSQTFRFNQWIGSRVDTYLDTQNRLNLFFYLPSATETVRSSNEWARLEKLPEGSVAEAYVSLDHYYEQSDVLSKFDGKEMELVWYAVRTAVEGSETGEQAVWNPLGFPSIPLYHHDKSGLQTDDYKQTLQLLLKYKSITRSVVSTELVKDALDYADENGVQIYGVVATGPVKELLKLQEVSFVKAIRLGEVRLWNWNQK